MLHEPTMERLRGWDFHGSKGTRSYRSVVEAACPLDKALASGDQGHPQHRALGEVAGAGGGTAGYAS